MKRYDIANRDADDFPYVAVMRERADGDYCALADLHAWALKHKATVEKMPHASSCLALFCSRCLTPVDSMKHQFEPNECNCPRGDALREIEELL